jgi:hypothetical protein
MSIIIGFLDLNKGIILVSKYWKIITLESKENLISDPEKRKPNEPNFLENNRVLVNQLKSEAGEKGKRIITMKDIISESVKNYNNLDQKLYKKIVGKKGVKNYQNEEIKTKKVYWEEKSSEQNDNYRNTNNNGSSNENSKIIKNGKLVNGGNHGNYEGNGQGEVVEEEEEQDTTPRITIRSRKNVQNSKNNNENNENIDDDDGDILKRYGMSVEESEEGEMKQISLSDDGYDNTTQNNGYDNKNQISLEKNDNFNTISNSQKTVLTENSTEITPSINGNEEEEETAGNYDHLLIHVKDIRSESQLTDLIEFIQDGYVTIETAAEEKKRLKRRIKGDLLL